jgi:hypothetical protein
MKNWFNQHKNFLENGKIIELWCNDNDSDVSKFIDKFKESVAYVSQDK